MIRVSQSSLLIVCLLLFLILSWAGLTRAKEFIIPEGAFTQETVAFPEAMTYVDTVKELEEHVEAPISTFNVLPDSFERISMGYKKVQENSFITRQTFIRYPEGKMTFEQAPKDVKDELPSPSSSTMKEFNLNGQLFHMNGDGRQGDYVMWEKGDYVYAVSTNVTFSMDDWELLLDSLQ
ncbi:MULTISPECIES: hypothetical protein [Pontibacillus]|uniref:DUF4367 domain-containing protein n=1 Tax=Pontibacillus chungwhensis TaxID=265426 RepID=A0ABY8V3Y0_9BACI|nr:MULTISPECIES: hypothetical protein [Pontibacillus]MCD5322435.1 hypothetical protein [Pontibacillus sp. HN14]WIF99721.1 hypothetical protein QNI29_08720 [Pontibacillus chungwhensis]